MLSMPNFRRTAYRGFTLVELLVVIAIIGMLVALLIPAVGAARARMRKAACLNNMNQIGKALINYDSTKQRLPGYIESLKARGRDANKTNGYVVWGTTAPASSPAYVGSVYLNNGDPSAPAASRIAWSAHILPQIDREDIWELIQGAVGSSDDSDMQAQQTVPKIELYVCADDTDLTSTENAAGISYSVNTGVWDWDGSNYEGDTKQNGLFQNLSDGNVKARLSDAKDGSATTIMVIENLTKNENYSWLGVNATPGEQQFGVTWAISTAPVAGCGGRDEQYGFNDDGNNDGVAPGQWPANQPCFARPYSLHSGGGINTIFADGHGDSLSNQLDYIVYQQLLTTHGAKCIDPANPNDTTGAIDAFRAAPPLSEADLE